MWQNPPVSTPRPRLGIVRNALPYSQALRPGGFDDARLVAGTGQAPLLPESAVQSGPEVNFVLIVGKGDQIERRPVKVGTITDDGVSIASGLTGNERVVVLAGAFLNPGDRKSTRLNSSH